MLSALLLTGCGGRAHHSDDDDTAGDGDADTDGDADGDGDGDGDADGDADLPCEESAEWERETILPGDVERGAIFPSIAVDEAGVVHVSWTEIAGALWYANDADDWQAESVTAEGGIRQTSLAIDPGGVPTLAYFAEPPRDLVVARRDGVWASARVDEAGNVGWSPSLAFAGGAGHVVYGSTEEGLRHAVLGGALETIDPGANGASGGRLAIGPGDALHVVARRWDGARGTLLYAESAGADWDVTAIGAEWSAGADLAIAVAADGTVNVAAAEVETSVLHHLRYAAGTWEDWVLDPQGGTFPDLVVDAGGDLHVVYYWYDGGDLRHGRLHGNDWEFETIASAGDVGQFHAAAIASDGTPWEGSPAIQFLKSGVFAMPRYPRTPSNPWNDTKKLAPSWWKMSNVPSSNTLWGPPASCEQ